MAATLVALLKQKSHHFSTTLAKQEFVYEERKASASDNEALRIEVELMEAPDQQDDQVVSPKTARYGSSVIHTGCDVVYSPQQRSKLVSDQKKRAKDTPTSGVLEPSQKWKALGVTTDYSQTKPRYITLTPYLLSHLFPTQFS